MMKNWPWELIVGIIGSAFFTAFFGWLFTRSTNKLFRETMKAMAGFLENSLANNKVTFRRNKKGEPIGANIVKVISETLEVSSTPENPTAVPKNEETGEK